MTATRNGRAHGGPTVLDVAKLAGVSTQTVSRVANGRTNVEEPTRKRVLEAMRTLNYRPNAAARSLATARTGTIGLITSTLSTYGTMRIVDGISDAAQTHGYTIALMPLKLPSAGDVSGAAASMARLHVDGVIVIVESSALEKLSLDLPAGLPVVLTDGDASHRFLSIDSDAETGVRVAVEHLIALGHTHISHVAGPLDSYQAGVRTRSWANTLRDHKLRAPRPLRGDWSAESGYAAGRRLARAGKATAVVAANDQMALGVIRAYADEGLRVPQDVSVIGFDDMLESRHFVPRLTTIRQDFPEIGRQAVRALHDRMDPSHSPEPVAPVPTVFIERESTSVPHSGGPPASQ
jgi:DNA-binding LacI/PurR family transcriptional regulator